MPRTPTPFFNALDGKAYDDLLGLIAAGEVDADIADWLDCTEEYVAEVRAELAAAAASTAAINQANAMIIKAQYSRRVMALDTSDYNNPPMPTILSASTAAGRRTLSLPGCTVTLDGEDPESVSSADLVLNTAASWDTATPTDYTVAATRAGVSFFIYATGDGYLLSADDEAPDGYTTADSRKIGGFACVKTEIGTGIADAELYGFLAGDIIPGTIWDINPATVPE